MFQIVIETVASALAEAFIGKAVEKGQEKHKKLFGWLGLITLFALVAGLAFLGIYLLGEGVWPIAILMFLIALFILYITIAASVQNVRAKKTKGKAE